MIISRILTTLAFAVMTINGYGQINPTDEKDKVKTDKIGTAKNLGLWMADLVRLSKDRDTSYIVYFNNAKYTTISDIKHFSFKETGGDLDRLYQIIITTLVNREKKDVEIPLEKGTLTLEFTGKAMRFNWFSLGVLSYSVPMNNIQIKKLFGKEVKDEDYDK